MAFFNNYSKPGKGVDKDEKRPIGFVMFFVLLGRKFGSYVKLNLMYLLTCIPSILTLFFVISSFIFGLNPENHEDMLLIMSVSLVLAVALAMIYGLSPFSSGFYYILRNFAREEHSWMSDFWSIFKDNMKHSLITWVIDSLIVILAVIALRTYLILAFAQNSMFMIPLVIMIMFLVIFALSVPYRWTTMVTFESTLKQIYKNSIFFVMGNSWRTLAQFIFSAIWAAIVVVCCTLFSVVAYLVFALIGFSVYGLIQAVAIYPVIGKYTNPEKFIEDEEDDNEEEKDLE